MSDETMVHEQEVMSATEPVMSIAPVGDVRALARGAAEQVKAVQAIIRHALDITEPSHWVIMGGGDDPKVYLTEAGAKRIARLFGVNWTNLRSERMDREDSNGKYYRWRYMGTFSLKRTGDSIDEIGTCNSRDQFFAKRGDEWLPSEDVDEDNIEKAALTNCLTRGITGLIGIRGLTVSSLPKKLQGGPRVTFRDGSQRGGKAQDDTTIQKAAQIGLWLLEMNGEDKGRAADDLERRTTFQVDDPKEEGGKRTVPGKRSAKKITSKQADYLFRDLLKEIEAFRAQQTATQGKVEPAAEQTDRPPVGENGNQPDLDFGDPTAAPWDGEESRE